jgi:hypothetical protein
MRNGAGAGLLAGVAGGRLTATHEALDTHLDRLAADYLRHMLTVGGTLPPRDEELACIEQRLAALLASAGAPSTGGWCSDSQPGQGRSSLLAWAARRGHCRAFAIPGPGAHPRHGNRASRPRSASTLPNACPKPCGANWLTQLQSHTNDHDVYRSRGNRSSEAY